MNGRRNDFRPPIPHDKRIAVNKANAERNAENERLRVRFDEWARIIDQSAPTSAIGRHEAEIAAIFRRAMEGGQW